MPFIEGQPLRILHATRAPVGGIIRHILDLPTARPTAAIMSGSLPTA
jgi:hypothetical protein